MLPEPLPLDMSDPASSSDAVPAPDDTRLVPAATPARTLYVDTTGAVVRCKRERLLVQQSTDEGRETLAAHPISDLDTVVLVGQATHCTTPVLRLCMHRDVTVVLLTTHGRLTTRIAPPTPERVDVRRAQHDAGADTERRCAFARAWVGAKIHNMRHRLVRWAGDPPASDVEAALDSLSSFARRCGSAGTLDILRGLEGTATRAYFGTWPALIEREEPTCSFAEGRSRRPPEDAVNALLGFTYALLQKDVRAACAAAGLDSGLGLLHEPRRGVPATVLDLMEPFRSAVADPVVLGLLNRRVVGPAHVEERDGGVYLNKKGRTAVYRAYGRRRTDTVTPPDYDRALPYVRVFELQARRLARTLTTENTSFSAFRLS